jgi:hypothetical protein
LPAVCKACTSVHSRAIAQKIKAQVPYVDIARWLAEAGEPIERRALSRHAHNHIGSGDREPGPKPPSGDFLRTVVERAHEGVVSGDLRVGVKDGIAAQAEINRQGERMRDQDLFIRIALALTGNVVGAEARVLDPEIEAIEAQFRPLLEAGDESVDPYRHDRETTLARVRERDAR